MSTTVKAGQTFAFSGVLDAGATLTGRSGKHGTPQGAVIQVASTAVNDGTIDLLASPAHVGLQGGTGATLQITGTLTNTGVMNLSGGAYGTANPRAGAITGASLLDQGMLINAGEITVDAGIFGSGPHTFPGPGATLVDSGQLINSATLTVGAGSEAAGTDGATLNITATGNLYNTGLVSIMPGDAAASELAVSGTLANAGMLNLAAGGLVKYPAASLGAQMLLTGLLTNTGSIAIAGVAASPAGFSYTGVTTGATLTDNGVLTNDNAITIGSGGPSHYSNTAGLLIDSGVLTNNGSVSVAGATVSLAGSGEAGFYATLMVAGVLTNNDQLTLSGGSYGAGGGLLDDAGRLANTGTLAAYGGQGADRFSPLGRGSTIDVRGVLHNSGLIDIHSGTPRTEGNAGLGATLQTAGTLVNTGHITLDAALRGVAGAAFVDAGGVLQNAGTIDGGGTLYNNGMIGSGGQSITTGLMVLATLVNTGMVDVAPHSALTIDAAIYAAASAHGSLQISAGGVLTLAGTVTANQTISFATGATTLAVADGYGFAGVLAGLVPDNIIDFLQFDVTSATTAGTSLDLRLNTGATLDLTLAAPLPAGTTLNLTPDQHGGTDLLFGHA